MSKSPKRIAKQALEAAKRSLPTYSATHSPRKFTQHQLFAIGALRHFFRVDYRGIVAILQDSSDLRRVLGLRTVPHYSTLAYAEKRFSQGGVRLVADLYGARGSFDRTAA
jgi:Transposase domain (DUF772)